MEVFTLSVDGQRFERSHKKTLKFVIIFLNGELTVAIGKDNLYASDIAKQAGFSVSPLGGGILVYKLLSKPEVDDRVFFRWRSWDFGGVPAEVADKIRPALLALIQKENPWIISIEDRPEPPEVWRTKKWMPVLELLNKGE